jgi:hypothetical protein
MRKLWNQEIKLQVQGLSHQTSGLQAMETRRFHAMDPLNSIAVPTPDLGRGLEQDDVAPADDAGVHRRAHVLHAGLPHAVPFRLLPQGVAAQVALESKLRNQLQHCYRRRWWWLQA